MVDASSNLTAQLTRQVQPVGRSEAVRAAQKAFFQAALNPPAAATQAAVTTAQTTASTLSVSGGFNAFDPNNPPDRLLRPGSLVDIKV